MKKTLLSLAVLAALSTGSASAAVLENFTIDEGSVPDANAGIIIDADKLNGGYNEAFSVFATGPSSLGFSSKAYANFSAIYGNDGGDEFVSQLGSHSTITIPNVGTFPIVSPYQIYATFDAVGSVTLGASGQAQFNGSTGSFSLFIDVDSNTTKTLGADGLTPVSLGNTSDDYLIASSSTMTILKNQIGNPGSFDLWFKDFLLSSGDMNAILGGVQNGEQYFIAPNPFYLTTNVDGDFDNIAFDDILGAIGPDGRGIFTTTVTGDVSAVFVPEPGTLALLGLGLSGLGLSLRRRKTA